MTDSSLSINGSQTDALQRAIDKAWGNMHANLLNTGDEDFITSPEDTDPGDYRKDAMARRLMEAL